MSSMLAPEAVFIATLGTEPQVITAALDLLLRRGEPIRQVVVLHTVSPGTAIEAARRCLEQEFTRPHSTTEISLRFAALQTETAQAVSDVESPHEVQAAFKTIYREVRQAKLAGKRVHLSIAGGRKSLAVFGMAAAQLLFDEDDHLWHLYSAGEFLESKRLHPQPGDQAHLISIPVIRWSQVSPALGEIGSLEDPFAAIEAVCQLQLNEQIESARAFILGALTPAEARTVELLVREGLTDGEIAHRLTVSPRTIESQLRAAYAKAQAHWNLTSVSRVSLVRLLYLYYSTKFPENPG